MSKLRLSFHGIKGSGHLGQAELYPDYWNFKIILGKGKHIVNKVLKSRIRMYGSLYLIKSQWTTKSMSNLRLSFHGIKGSSHLGQAELYPDYWNVKIILSKGKHIVNKVLKSRIPMYGSLYLIKSQSTTKYNFRTERPFDPKMLQRPVSFLFYGIWKIWHQWSQRR